MKSRRPSLLASTGSTLVPVLLIGLFGASAPKSVAQALTPADRQLTPDRDSALPDPASRSGWIRIEVAVLADDTPGALGTESWPATPEVRYPNKARWLVDLMEPRALRERFPGAVVRVDERGQVTVTLPPPAAPLEQVPTREDGDVSVDGSAPSIDPMTGRPGSAADAGIPLEAIGPVQPGAPEEATPKDWLAPFAESDETPAKTDTTAAAPPRATAPATAAAPPTPVPFARRDPELLAPGLNQLRRQTGREVRLDAAWLQPPGAANLPLILDTSGDASPWPALQGFVELRRGSDLRVGVNFWLNTTGDYLPAGFAMDPPPRAPQRLQVRESPQTALLGTELAGNPDLSVGGTLREPESTPGDRAAADAQVTFVDPETGMPRTAPSGPIAMGDPPDGDTWPYRHLIHIADTREVPEGLVRYYDHPVVQVLVTWRELPWRDVWALGEADAALQASEQAIESDTAGPASTVPPSQRGLQ